MIDQKSGSTLIEVIIAVGIVALVLITIVSVITVSIRDTVLAKSKVLGTRYAQEGMEFFRRERNSLGWETFVSTIQAHGAVVTYCLPSSAITQTLPSLAVGVCNNTQFADPKNVFQRAGVATIASPTQVNISVTVSWKDNSLSQTAQVAETFLKN